MFLNDYRGYTGDTENYELVVRSADKDEVITIIKALPGTNQQEMFEAWVDYYLEALEGDINLEAEYADLRARCTTMENAIKAVLRHISSNQVYDKDSRGTLERAIYHLEKSAKTGNRVA